MLRLKGEHIHLRALEPEDLDFLYEIENNPEIWEISGTTSPYSRHVLRQYLENAHRDIYEVKQLRLVIEQLDGPVLGLIDLFDFDPKNRRAGIGIVIHEHRNRNKGAATKALSLLCDYAFNTLELHQVYANIGAGNDASTKLFERLGFERVGLKKDWNLVNGKFRDELLYQKLNT